MALPSQKIISHPHVQTDPSVLGGSPYVRGTRIPVRRLWAWHRRGATVETLLKRYPQLGPARVLDALAFAYDNEALVENDLAQERQLMERAVSERAATSVVSIAASKRGTRPVETAKAPQKLRERRHRLHSLLARVALWRYFRP